MPTTTPQTGHPSANRLQAVIAGGVVAAIAAHLLLQYGLRVESLIAGLRVADLPLLAALVLGGVVIGMTVGFSRNAIWISRNCSSTSCFRGSARGRIMYGYFLARTSGSGARLDPAAPG